MTKIDTLKRIARAGALEQGHVMRNFRTIVYGGTYKSPTAWEPVIAESKCKKCGAYVRVNSKPLPNEIDVSGSIYGAKCAG